MSKNKSAGRQDAMRELLAYQLSGHGAHIAFSAAVKGFPVELAGNRVPHLEHTAWGLVYHLRVAQWDMLEYARGVEHESLPYPSGYWPQTDGPRDAQDWDRTVRSFGRDLKAMERLVLDPQRDLYAPLRPGSDWSLLQQATLVIDHNSYHIGQLVDLRMLLEVPVRDW
jgi:DinB superfamily